MVDIAVGARRVGQCVADGIDRRAGDDASDHLAGLRLTEVVDGDRRVVGAGDVDRELGDVVVAQGVAHQVAEVFADDLAGTQALHGSIALAEGIGVRAVGSDAQVAVGARDRRAAACRNGGEDAASRLLADPDPVDGAAFAVGVDGVAGRCIRQHVAARRRNAAAARHSARLGGRPDVIDADRVVVGTLDGDGQRRGRRHAALIAEFVGEDLGQRIAAQA